MSDPMTGCGEKFEGFACTEPLDHAGDHVARGHAGTVYRAWRNPEGDDKGSICGAIASSGFSCTLRSGHKDSHIATDGRPTILDDWDQDEDEEESETAFVNAGVRVYKYVLSEQDFEIPLADGHELVKILTVQNDPDGITCVWCEVDTSPDQDEDLVPAHGVCVRVIPTGYAEVPEGRYLNTYFDGDLVLHAYVCPVAL